MKNKIKDSLFEFATFLGSVVISVCTRPILSFIAGWCGGLLVKLLVGRSIAACINALLGIVRFSPNDIPVICGIFSVIGSFFRDSVTISEDDDEDEKDKKNDSPPTP